MVTVQNEMQHISIIPEGSLLFSPSRFLLHLPWRPLSYRCGLVLPFLERYTDLSNQDVLIYVWHFSFNIFWGSRILLHYTRSLFLFILVCRYYNAIQYPVGGYLGCFLFSTTMTKATITISWNYKKSCLNSHFFIVMLWEQKKFFTVAHVNCFLVLYLASTFQITIKIQELQMVDFAKWLISCRQSTGDKMKKQVPCTQSRISFNFNFLSHAQLHPNVYVFILLSNASPVCQYRHLQSFIICIFKSYYMFTGLVLGFAYRMTRVPLGSETRWCLPCGAPCLAHRGNCMRIFERRKGLSVYCGDYPEYQ